MAKSVFVTGTGTDIGKTYVTALIVKKLQDAGFKAGYYKAAVSGNIRDEKGELIPGDAEYVKRISGSSMPLADMCPYVYENAYSPHLASRIEGNPVDYAVVEKGFYKAKEGCDYLTVEGSGGIICPIGFDTGELYLPDIIKGFSLKTVLVADAGLGTINNVVLTHEYMKTRGIECQGVIYNNYTKGDVMHEDNIFMCNHLTGLKTLAVVRKGETVLDISVEELVSIFE